jgi:hypothetical protein
VSAVPPSPPGVPRGFTPRTVALDQLPALVREAAGLFARAPARLCGLYLLVFLAVLLLPDLPYVARPLRATIDAVGVAGFFVALESARQGRAPSLLDMALPWRLAPNKLVLLVAAGLVPLLAVLLVWWLDIGGAELDALLGGSAPDSRPSERQQMQDILVRNFVSMPLLFLQPFCVLFSWSASRTVSATLLAWLANWRWALALTLVSIPIEMGLGAIDSRNVGEVVLALIAGVASDIFQCAFTLVLMQRSLRN